jgi:flagellar assembly factor FliW
MHDEDEDASTIMWLQSIDEPESALPVMNPLIVCPDYKPVIDKNGVEELGELDDQEILVLVTVTVPHDLTKMTVNLMGPIIINTKDMKASQNIVDNDEYPVKFPIYDILKKNKEAKG